MADLRGLRSSNIVSGGHRLLRAIAGQDQEEGEIVDGVDDGRGGDGRRLPVVVNPIVESCEQSIPKPTDTLIFAPVLSLTPLPLGIGHRSITERFTSSGHGFNSVMVAARHENKIASWVAVSSDEPPTAA